MSRLFFGCGTFVLLAVVLALPLHAQEDADSVESGPWTRDGSMAINLNQVALSNWAGGGENTITVGGLLGVGAFYDEGSKHWANTLEVGYGVTKIADLDLRKSDDKLNFVSKFDINATETLLYSALLDFRTQMTDGFDYSEVDGGGNAPRISTLLAPGYLNLGLGATWKPDESFELLVAPLSNRLTMVLDDTLSAAGAFGVDPGDNFGSALGATSRAKFQKNIMENVTFGSNLNLFAPYAAFTKVIVNWESLLAMKVNDYITTSVSFDVIYDEAVDVKRDDGTIGPATQFKEALAIGFGVQF